MDDATFLARFETGELTREDWTHRAHLRVAYLYLTSRPFDEAVGCVRAGIRALNAVLGIVDGPESGYHETLTRTWCHILDGVIRAHGPAEGSDAFLEAQPYLLEPRLPRLYYSRPRMTAPEARTGYLEPDLSPFPRPSGPSEGPGGTPARP